MSVNDDVFRRLVVLEDVDGVDDDALLMKLVLSICSSLDAFCFVEHHFKGFRLFNIPCRCFYDNT